MIRNRRCSGQTAALLRCLFESPSEWRHGYEISKATALKSGTLYPILMRLTDRGLLEAQWQPAAQPGRPPRHLYRLTTRGVVYAEQELAACASPNEFAIQPGRA